MGELEALLDKFPKDVPAAAIDSVIKANNVIDRYSKPACFLIACRPEDDIMLDLLTKIDDDRRLKYYVVCTMTEFNLLYEHLKHLERKYRIGITPAIVVSDRRKTIKNFADAFNADLVVTSERQHEGDRESEFSNCMTRDNEWIDSYRPLFWFSDEDVKAYDEVMDIVHAEART